MSVKHKINIFEEEKNVWHSYDFGWFLWKFFQDFGWFCCARIQIRNTLVGTIDKDVNIDRLQYTCMADPGGKKM